MFPPAPMQRDRTTSKIQCVLAHPHVLLREGVCRLLRDESDLEVVAEAGNAGETVRLASQYRPDVVIADAQALGLAAREFESLIRNSSSTTKIVFLNSNPEQPLQLAAEGDAGLARPNANPLTPAEQLVNMIRSAASEGGPCLFVPSASTPGVCEMPRLGRSSTQALAPRKQVLTTREREVLKLLAEGRTVRSAALALGVSAKTVDAHKFNLMRKLGLHNKVDLVVSAIQMGVLKVPANF